MIGIDIIDLEDPQLKSREKALRFIIHPDDTYPEEIAHKFWAVWTAKEAIFKARREIKPFDPKLIQLRIFKSGIQYHFSSKDISGEIYFDKDHIIATAKRSNNQISFEVSKRTSSEESKEVREIIVNHFKEEKSLTIEVSKDENGLPFIDYRKMPISISHHGRFLSFAYPNF